MTERNPTANIIARIIVSLIFLVKIRLKKSIAGDVLVLSMNSDKLMLSLARMMWLQFY